MVVEYTGKTTGCGAEIAHIEVWSEEGGLADKAEKNNADIRFLERNTTEGYLLERTGF